MPRYDNEQHANAVDKIYQAQVDRRDSATALEPSLRAIESMAPENTGRRRHRAMTIAMRTRLAIREGRAEARQDAREHLRRTQ
jgi:hypothetical protein